MNISTGVRRLDELLRGGVPASSQTLIYGAPFLGKDVLAHGFALANLREERPAVFLLTNDAAVNVRKHLQTMDAAYATYEANGLVRFIDAYSRSLGIAEDQPHTEYVDGVLNLNGLSVAVNNAEKAAATGHEHHTLVVDSVSTIIAMTNPQTAFRFLQVLVGKTRMSGATGMLLLDHGMHTDAEVQMFKHLMSGVIELKQENGKNLLRVEGIGVTEDRSWVEYRFNGTSFEITGSFAAGRIR